jgi:hypothetical protein
MRKRCSIIMVAAVAGTLLSAPVRAQDSATLDHNYFGLKLTLGVGGTRTVQSGSVSVGALNVNVSDTVKRKDNLLVSYGAAGQYMIPLHRFFALGGLVGIMSWKSSSASSDASRNLGFDLAVVPQGKLPISNELELYLSLPVGLTLDLWNEVQSSNSVGTLASVQVKSNAAVGFTISLLAGARYALSERIGLFSELGFTHRQFSHELSLTASAVGFSLPAVKTNADVTLDQFAWNIGMFF